MIFTELPIEERVKGFSHVLSFDHTDLTQATANTAQALDVAIPAGSSIRGSQIRIDVPFENTADAAFDSTAITVGDAGSATRHLASTQANANGTVVPLRTAAVQHDYTAADVVKVTVGSMSGKSLSNLNKGAARVFVDLILPRQQRA
jgi:hypothetical protein